MNEQQGVVITFAQMYRELQATHGEVVGMRGELRAALEDNADLKRRVTVLEEWKWKLTGMATAAGSVAGALAYLITRSIGG